MPALIRRNKGIALFTTALLLYYLHIVYWTEENKSHVEKTDIDDDRRWISHQDIPPIQEPLQHSQANSTIETNAGQFSVDKLPSWIPRSEYLLAEERFVGTEWSDLPVYHKMLLHCSRFNPNIPRWKMRRQFHIVSVLNKHQAFIIIIMVQCWENVCNTPTFNQSGNVSCLLPKTL